VRDININVIQDMGTHDVYDSPVDKERIVDYVGGGAGHQAIHVRSMTGPGRSGVRQSSGIDLPVM